MLLPYPILRKLIAMHHYAARSIDIIIGKMRVGAFEMQHFKQILQFVLSKFGMQQTYKSQRVEIRRMQIMQIKVWRVATKIEVKYVIVVIGIVSEQSTSVGISHKLA